MRHAWFCSLLAGCGFTASGTAPVAEVDGGPPLTPTTFLTRLVSAECTQAFACRAEYPANAQRSFSDEWGADLDDCLSTDRDVRALPAIDAAITAGTITFDPAAAITCLAAPGIPTRCAVLFGGDYEWAPACFAALLGHVAEGGACTTGWECAGTTHCANARCAR